MELPLHLVKGVINERTIYMFSLGYKNNPSPHYYICLKINSESIVFSCCTSQETNAIAFLQRSGLPLETLVYIDENDSNNPFSTRTYVNCNTVEEVSWDDFNAMRTRGKAHFKGTLDEDCYEKIVKGILLSPNIERRVKKMFM